MQYDVFIFAGQSNMHGSDAIIDSTDKTLDLVEKGIQQAPDAAARFVLAGGLFSYGPGDIRGHAGTSLGASTVAGVPIMVHGPEVGFNRLLNRPSTFIMKYTTNFSALESGLSPWAPGKSVWNAWQTFLDTQLAAITSGGNAYRVVGICWHQGIDDGVLARSQAAYELDLRNIIQALRAKFGAGLPFILARSVNSQIAGSANMVPIRAGQLAVAKDARNDWVDVDDLTPYVNTHHMTAANQIIHGNRMAQKFIAMTLGESSRMKRKVAGAVLDAKLFRKAADSLAPAFISAKFP
jgi:hypothetical protein